MTKLTELNLVIDGINQDSQLYSVLNDLTKRWAFPVIQSLRQKEPARFNELKKRIHGMSATSLAKRLSDFEKKGIVERIAYPEIPPRVEYMLTAKGCEFSNLLSEFEQWAVKWQREDRLAPHKSHATVMLN